MNRTALSNIHLPLKFIGNIVPNEIDNITQKMLRISEYFSPINLNIRSIGVFPNIKRPAVIWAGIPGQTLILEKLQVGIESALEELNFQSENRPFKPHLTIGLIKKRIDSRKLSDAITRFWEYQTEEFIVDTIYLIKSELNSKGAIYSDLAKIDLKKWVHVPEKVYWFI